MSRNEGVKEKSETVCVLMQRMHIQMTITMVAMNAKTASVTDW